MSLTITVSFFRRYLAILPYSLWQSMSAFLNANFLTDNHSRIFELFMAFDALRLRNIIQLIGLLSDSIILISRSSCNHPLLVFHVALIIAAALQVSQTRTALVKEDNCDGEVNFVVSDSYLTNHLPKFLAELRRSGHTMEQS